MRTLKAFLFIFIFVAVAKAEYRVFRLQISNVATESYREFESTLDPQQYKGLFPLLQGERITYVTTWRCRGRTDNFRPHCANPRQPAAEPDQDPATPTSQSPEIPKSN